MRLLIFVFYFIFAAAAFAGNEKFAPESLDGSELAALRYYISKDKYQEAIWMLEERGYFQTAHKYKMILKEKMLADVVSTESVARGVSVKYKLNLSSQITGLFKPAKGQSSNDARIKTEVAVYWMDQILDLHVVPMTIIREDKERKLGTFQYWIHDARLGGRLSNEIRFLDKIVYNQDRHNNNRLSLSDLDLGGIFRGRMIGIDHNRTFGNEGMHDREEFDFVPSRHAWEKLNELQDDGVMHKYFDGLLDVAEFKNLDQRIDSVITFVKNRIEKKGEDVVFLKSTEAREPRADIWEIHQKVPAELLDN